MQKQGFTLIELSIVLVILGLIVGGIVGGKSLIRQTELQNIVREVNALNTAVNTFKLEYDHLPGDFPEAEDYWGSSNATNGNGDGYIDPISSIESRYGLHHMSMAEIVPYTFIDFDWASPDWTLVPGRMLYPSKVNNAAGYSMMYDQPWVNGAPENGIFSCSVLIPETVITVWAPSLPGKHSPSTRKWMTVKLSAARSSYLRIMSHGMVARMAASTSGMATQATIISTTPPGNACCISA